MIRAPALALLRLVALTACGLRPMYAGGSSGAVATSLRSIQVRDRSPARAGWLVRNALVDRLGAMPDGTPTYRLEVELDDNITGFGIRGDSATTRERRTLRARYRLVELSTGAVVLDATAGSDAGIDVVSREYATIAAEQTALERLAEVVADQIVGRLGSVRGAHRGDGPVKIAKGGDRARDRPARPGDPLLPVPRPRRCRSRGSWRPPADGPGRRREIRACWPAR